jgi:transposase InsO family protein
MAAFLERALAHFAASGIEVKRLLTDNGLPYRSHLFRSTVARCGLRQLYARPYRPQTHGKAEAFVKIVQNGSAGDTPLGRLRSIAS